MSPEQLDRLVASLAAEPARWRHLVRHEHDVRVYEQLLNEDHVNAWLICWSGGQDTGFHDHDESAGAIAVLSGRVREERLAVGAPALARDFAAGQRFAIPPNAIHRVVHAGRAPAVTLHAYSPPLLRMGAYAVGADGELERHPLDCRQELRAERSLIEAIG
ncbi:MAG TPA: cysteine dioxygenase family protein [Solirubrobacteraceae bacterium]|jgi:quercetin dioxygenase-like cupin family protein